jgi:hypothetical protein
MSAELEYICVTILGRVGEPEAKFAARLSEFWSDMLRELPDEFERVYAEAIAFEEVDGRVSRQYLVEAELADLLEARLRQARLDFLPIDRDDRYSKYEATPSEWMQIEH